MYAVIETGGKQYRVEVGTELEVELLDVEPGKTITLDRVLLVADGDEAAIGRPLVADAAVSAEVVRQTRGPKLISFKYRPKARTRVKKGHRQDLTILRISDITFGGKSAAGSAKKSKDEAKTERQRLEEAAAVRAAKDAELAATLAVGAEAPATKAPTKKATAPKATETKATEAKAEPTKTTAAPKAAAAKPAAAKPAAPKKPSVKPAPADTGAETPKPKAAAPKKPRATKKDES